MVPGQELSEATAVVASAAPQVVSTTTSVAAVPPVIETNALQTSAPVSMVNQEITASNAAATVPLAAGSLINARPGSMVRVPEMANGRKLIIVFFIQFAN